MRVWYAEIIKRSVCSFMSILIMNTLFFLGVPKKKRKAMTCFVCMNNRISLATISLHLQSEPVIWFLLINKNPALKRFSVHQCDKANHWHITYVAFNHWHFTLYTERVQQASAEIMFPFLTLWLDWLGRWVLAYFLSPSLFALLTSFIWNMIHNEKLLSWLSHTVRSHFLS